MGKGTTRRDWLVTASAWAWGSAGASQISCQARGALCRLLEAAGTDGSNTHGVWIERAGQLLAQAYYSGRDKPNGAWFEREVQFSPEVAHDLRSISKSVTGVLAGFVYGQGVLGSLDRPVFDFFPEHADLVTPEKRLITIEHLLDMTVGWQWDESSHSYGSLSNSETRMTLALNRDRHLLDLPLVHKPGTQWAYSGGATALLGEILERVTGQPLLALANQRLFGPLGFTDVTWRTGWRDKALAFSGLRLKPRELARIGRLLLGGGQWQGAGLVPAAWVANSLQPRVQATDGYWYGRQWWHGQFTQGAGAGVAWTAGFGNGGQRLFMVPALDLVVVVTAGRYNQPANGRASNNLLRAIVDIVRA